MTLSDTDRVHTERVKEQFGSKVQIEEAKGLNQPIPRVSEISESELDFDIDFSLVCVTDPQKADGGNNIIYKICGFDKMGYFKNIERRYSDFFTLHELISERYRGIYVPYLPPKKTFGKNDEKFVEKRRLGL